MGCTVDNCGRKTIARGYCTMHYQRYYKRGSAYAKVKPLEYHGMDGTQIYRTWQYMKSRCSRPQDDAYYLYGGRGIRVCDKWFNSFVEFYKDMGPKPTPKHTIERIDTNGNYTPENCKWATRQEQVDNRRNTRKYEGKIAREWAVELGVRPKTFSNYITRQGIVKAIAHYKELSE